MLGASIFLLHGAQHHEEAAVSLVPSSKTISRCGKILATYYETMDKTQMREYSDMVTDLRLEICHAHGSTYKKKLCASVPAEKREKVCSNAGERAVVRENLLPKTIQS